MNTSPTSVALYSFQQIFDVSWWLYILAMPSHYALHILQRFGFPWLHRLAQCHVQSVTEVLFNWVLTQIWVSMTLAEMSWRCLFISGPFLWLNCFQRHCVPVCLACRAWQRESASTYFTSTRQKQMTWHRIYQNQWLLTRSCWAKRDKKPWSEFSHRV